MREKTQENGSWPIIVCVDDYTNAIPAGWFYHVITEQGTSFCNLFSFLKRLNGMLDELNVPQSFMSLRSFGGEREDVTFEHVTPRRGKKATFLLHVLFRQNAGWQGTVVWLEKEREIPFRSVLELLFLMDSALT